MIMFLVNCVKLYEFYERPSYFNNRVRILTDINNHEVQITIAVPLCPP